MTSRRNLPTARDKLLFTPGPLTTSLSVKQAMLHDAGSWHFEFNAKVKWVREKILEVAGLSSNAGWETILMQGRGTFGVEAVFAGETTVEGIRGVRAATLDDAENALAQESIAVLVDPEALVVRQVRPTVRFSCSTVPPASQGLPASRPAALAIQERTG